MLKRMTFGIFILGLLLLFPRTAIAEDVEILVCSGDTLSCTPKSCIEQCLRESDEPLDCPQVCTWEA